MSETAGAKHSWGLGSEHPPVARKASPLPRALRWAGPLCAAGFAVAVAARKLAYQVGLKRARKPPLSVLSVGNLTAGGTGKSPLVVYLARQIKARRMALHPSVLMRGYGAQAAGEKNDEATEIGLSLPGLPVICNPDRFAGATEAVQKGSDLALLDDGFQHWQLKRLLDIVLLDATDPFGGGHLLPWGYLRESPKALERAGIVILTRWDQADPKTLDEAFFSRLRALAPKALVCTARHRPVALTRLWVEGDALPLEALRGKRVVGACALGNPEAFLGTVSRLGAEVVARMVFRDHHPYALKDINALMRLAEARQAEAVVVSEKDAVKLNALLPPTGPLAFWALGVDFEIVDGEADFWRVIEAVLRAATPRIQAPQ